MRAGLKPTVDPSLPNDPFGILVRGGSNGTLKIDLTGRTNDTEIEAIDSTSLTATTRVTDASNNMGFSRLADGVNKLFIQTNGHAATDYHPLGGSFVKVPELRASIKLTVDTGTGTFDQVWMGQPEEDPTGTPPAVVDATVRTGAGHDIVLLGTDGDDPATATVDFGSGGVGNELQVYNGDSTVTLARTPGGIGAMDVAAVRVFSGAVVIDDPANIGTLEVNTSPFSSFGLDGIAIINASAAGTTVGSALVVATHTLSVQAN